MRANRVASLVQTLDLNLALVARQTVLPVLQAATALLIVLLGVCLPVAAQSAQTQASPRTQGQHPAIPVLPQARITAAVDMGDTVAVKNSVLRKIKSAQDLGPIPDSTPMKGLKLVFLKSPEQEAALQQLLVEQQNPSSPNFHKWVTPEEFGEHFGPAQSDIDAVSTWLESQGFSISGLSKGRQTLEFSGTASQVNAAFQTRMHRFTVDGEEHVANATEVRIPAALASVVAGVARLNDFQAKPGIQLKGSQFLPPSTHSSTGGITPEIFNTTDLYYSIEPLDFRKIYNEPSNWDGSGLTIGLPEEFGPDGAITNIANGVYGSGNYDNFNTVFGLPGGNLSIEYPFGQPSSEFEGAAFEADLDSQWAHAVAPGAKILMIPVGNVNSPVISGEEGIDQAQDYMVDQNLVDIISVSYGNDVDGEGESTYTDYVNNRGEQAAAQGISMMAGSGDWGSSGNSLGETQLDESDYADYSYVTSVGGTSIDPGANGLYWWGLNVADYTTTTVAGHIPENGWSGSGGGKSVLYSKPAWQTGVPGIPNDGSRDFPDVSFNADPWVGYLTCLAGGCSVTGAPILEPAGGTSVTSPIFAGVVALLDQRYGGRQGLLNPSLYKLGAGENWGNCNGSSQAESEPPSSCVFYDTTTGSNAVLGQPGYGTSNATYNAGQGYDLVTGLGSINISELLNKWGSVSYLPTNTSLSLPSTAFYGAEVSFSGTVTDPSNAGTPSGYVDLLSGGKSFGPYQLDGSGNFSGQVQGLPIGNASVVAIYGGDTNYATSQSKQMIAITKVTSTVAASLLPTLSTASYGANSYELIVSANGPGGYGNPTGKVSVYYTPASTGVQTYSGMYALSSTPGSSTGSEAILSSFIPNNTPPDTYTISVSYPGDSTFSGSSANPATSITITKATTSVSLSTTATAALVGTPIGLNAAITINQPATAPTGTVQFYQNGRAVGSPVALSNVTLSGSAYTALASVTTSALYPGSFPVTAIYSGDANDSTSTSNAVTIEIAGAPDTVSVTSNASGYDYLGSNLTLTATVFSQQSTPPITGSVQFFANGVSLGSSNVTSGTSGGKQIATATLQTTALPAGTVSVNAFYSGDANYDPEASFTISIPVTQTVPNGITIPSSLSFGDETVNAAATSQEAQLGNSGTANLVFGSATITGTNASSFSILSSSCPSGSQLVPYSGQYCIFNIGFTPKQSGALSASLVLTDNSPSSPHTIPLTGTGVPPGPYLQLSSPSLNFGVVTVNTTSDAQTATLTNIGNLPITSLSFSGLTSTPFNVSATTCPDALASQASCTLSITFSPTSSGLQSASLTINQDSSDGPVQTPISLSGQGLSAQGASLLGIVHTLPGSYSSPSSVVTDAQGNLYVSDTPNDVVYKVDPTGNQTTLPIAGLTSPGAMTMDANGYLYVVSNGGYNNVNVIKFKSATDQIAVPYTGISQATGVAVDTSGNIYVSVPSTSTVFQSAPGQSAATPIGFARLGVVEVNAVAIDSNNNMYVTGSNGGVNELNEIPGITGTYTTIASGLTNPVALAIGSSNSVYVADGTTNQVRAYFDGDSYLIVDSPAITGVSSVFVDAKYNTFLASAGHIFESSNLQTASAGFATIGTPGSAWVTMNVPAGNSISSINATDLAGDGEWTLPTGNTCTVLNNLCSFQVRFSPVYPGMRAGTVAVTDATNGTRTLNFYGVGQGPQAAFLTGNKTKIAGTWVPSALAADTAGNVYVLDQTNSTAPIIQRITTAGAVSTSLDSASVGGGADASLAVDGQGNIYLKPVNEGSGIYEYEYGGLNEVSSGSGAAGPFALDGVGDFYDSGANQVVVTDSRFNTLATYSYGSSSSVTVNNIAVDSLKNIYVTTSEPAVYMTSWAGVTTKLLDSTTSPGGFTLSNPTGIAVDAAGTVYVADAGANSVFRIDSQDNASAIGLNLTNPSAVGVTITPEGTLYLADQANAAVYRFDPANATFAFGNVNDETSSPVQSLLLTNTGNLPLAMSALSAPSGYLQQQDSTWCTNSTTLNNGGVCDLTFLLDPSSLGASNGSVTVTDNSLNVSSTQNVALTGQSVIGTPSQLVFSTPPPSSINALANFGQVTVQIKDQAGNVVTSSTDSVTLTAKDGSGNVFYTSSSLAVSGVVTFNLSASQAINAGTYTFIATDTTTTTATPTPTATSTVNSLSQTINFGSLSNQTYGVTPFTLNASATSGLSVTYGVSGPATVSGNTLTVSGAGLITVTAQQAGNGTYSAATNVMQSFTVAAALLTVTPNNTNKYLNQINPPLTYTITGYVNGDNVEFPVVSGSPNLSTTATTSSPVGNYPITGLLGSLTAANYVFQFGTGTLTVIQPSSPVTPPINWQIPVPITYGTQLGATQLNATSITAGTFVYSPAIGALLSGGAQTLGVTFYPTDTTDYTSATASVQIDILQAAPVLTVTSSANPGIAGSAVTFTATVTGIAGDAVPTGTVQFAYNSASNSGTQLSGLVPVENGMATFTTTTLPPGQQPYSIFALYGGDENYAGTQSGNLPQTIDPGTNVGSSSTFEMTVFVSSGSGTVANISVGAAGAAGQDFSLVPGGSCEVGGALSSNSTCTAIIKFAPTKSGVRYGAITLTDASGNIIATNQLAGIGFGPQVSFLPGTQSMIGSGFNQPGGVAVDGAGNVYVSDSAHSQVVMEPAGGGAPVVVDNSLSFPTGLAVDGAGNVYIADSANNRVVMDTLTSSGYVQSTIPTSPLNTPNAVAVDYNGDLFIADTFNSRILEETNSQYVSSAWTESVIPTSPLSNPGGVAVDAAGNVYIADTYNSRILEESPTSNGYSESTIPAPDSLVNPLSVAVDGNGSVYFSSFGGSGVYKETPSGGSYTETTLPLSASIVPSGLAIDGNGNLYLTNVNGNLVYEEDYSDAPSVSFAAPTNLGSIDTTDGPQEITVQNIGNATLTFPVPTSGNNPGISTSFTLASGVTGACPIVAAGSSSAATLPPGGNCTLPIEFQPIASGSLSGSLVLTDNALNAIAPSYATQTIQLTGTGTALPEASLSSANLIFDATTVNAWSASQWVSLVNTGAAPLAISSITVTGQNASQFVFGNTCGTTLAVGANCFIHGHFQPIATGAMTAQVIITDSAGSSPQSIAVSGTGLAPASSITLSQSNLVFGSANVGTATTEQTVTMTNSGSVAIAIASIAVGGGDPSSFLFANNCGTSLAAGASCTIHGHFAPATTGALTASVILTDSDASSPQSIVLSGTGVEPVVNLSTSTLSYGSVVVNTPSDSQSMTLTNTGTAVLTISSIAVTGANASEFVFANNCGTSLAVGAACTIHGHFAPATLGTGTASITITDNAPDSPESVTLTGTGTAPTDQVTLSSTNLLPGSSPTNLVFGSIDVGAWSASQTVILTNTGATTLSISSIVVGGTHASQFAFGNTCGATLAPGANCAIQGHFAPATTGLLSAAITITDSAPSSPQTIALSGTGVTPAVTLSSAGLGYAPTTVGASSGSQSVTMTNAGSAALTISSIAVTGADASSFVFANNCGTSLAAGASCILHGHFAPTATGPLTASITITFGAPGSPLSIGLSGSGE